MAAYEINFISSNSCYDLFYKQEMPFWQLLDLKIYIRIYMWVTDVWQSLVLVSDSGFLRTLDSSIKRNTAIIKKLKQINEEQREGLMDELKSVNLSKFVSEAVTAICDAKLRSSDIQAAAQVALWIWTIISVITSY